MTRRLAFIALGLAVLVASSIGAQNAIIDGGTVGLVINPVTPTVSSFAVLPAQQTRGLTIGPDGKFYWSWWTVNGIGVYDPVGGSWTTLVADPTNQLMGAPYQPAVDNEAIGGPGLFCVDGNPAPTSVTTVTGFRNLFRVDVNAATAAVDALFANTITPMADFYANPHKAGEYVGVGFSTSDQTVRAFVPQGGPTTIVPGVIATLTQPCQYDALIHDDTHLYCWTSTAATSVASSFVGFERVDLLTGATTTIPVSGITHAGVGYAACWNEPWELPGRKAYVFYDGTDALYSVDLSTNPTSAVAIAAGVVPAATYSTAREIEENQLTSYRVGTGRVFHMNFGANGAGKNYILAPSLFGYGGPTVLPGGRELWLIPDGFTALAIGNVLPGAPGQTVGILDKTGQKDVKFDLGVRVGVSARWVAVVLDSGRIADVSNIVNLTM